MRSPGLLEKHYSPRAALTLYTGGGEAPVRRLISDLEALLNSGVTRIGVLLPTEYRARVSPSAAIVVDIGPSDQPEIVATRLYAALRELDQAGVERILATDVSSDHGLGAALRDRLMRAAVGRIVRN
jgi:L-threonylcarbamoyladenylate synthase